jgi:hypothetical protein
MPAYLDIIEKPARCVHRPLQQHGVYTNKKHFPGRPQNSGADILLRHTTNCFILFSHFSLKSYLPCLISSNTEPVYSKFHTISHISWKVLKCSTGEGWRSISWTDHVRNEELLLRVKEHRNILHDISKRRLNGLVTFCVETAFYDRLF